MYSPSTSKYILKQTELFNLVRATILREGKLYKTLQKIWPHVASYSCKGLRKGNFKCETVSLLKVAM